jgi:hypothetical protein
LIRYITSSGPISSRIVGIFPAVCSCTHPLISPRVRPSAKSTSRMAASKAARVASRKAGAAANPSRYQIPFATRIVEVGSRPRRRSMRPR